MQRKNVGEKLSVLAKSVGLSQTALAEKLDIPSSQVNRFFRGHSDVYSSVLMDILKELGLDVDKMISTKIKKHTDIEDCEIETASDCVNYLFKNLDELGKQTYLNNLAWATRVTSKQSLPTKVEEILKRELNLI